MSRNKKIGQIYRERFEDARISPPEDSWEKIAAALPEKEEKRLLPLWLPIGGVAAALALVFFMNYEGATTETSIPVVNVDEKEQIQKVEENSAEGNRGEDPKDSKNQIATKEDFSGNSAAGPIASGVEEEKEKVKSDLKEGDKSRTVIAASQIGLEPIVVVQLNSLQAKREDLIPKHDTVLQPFLEISEPENILADKKDPKPGPEPEEIARFSISPKAGAVYSDRPGLAANSGGGQISMSYGVNLAYQVSDKIRLRTGIGKMNLKQQASGVHYLTAVDYGFVGETGNFPAPQESSDLEQELGYVEVPLEMEFALIDKKLGLSLIGGISTFWLDNNEISLEGAENSLTVGKAGNLNDLSFSTNLGLGLKYDLPGQMEWNLEPIFKYQWNTYTNNDLKPYILGVYSGIKFRF